MGDAPAEPWVDAGVRLTPDIIVVGGGRLALGIGQALDASLYLVDGGTERVLIDAGTGMDAEGVLARVAALDGAPVRRLLLTHEHPDHAAGAAEMSARLGCTVHASATSAAILRTGDVGASGLRAAIAAGVYPAGLSAPPVAVEAIADGQVVHVGRLRITAIATPGHVPGHLCYLMEGGERTALFTGDHLFWGGWVAAHDRSPRAIRDYRASLGRLATVRFQALLPGHLQVALRDGEHHVRQALTALGTRDLPRDMLEVLGLPRVPAMRG